MHRAPGIPHALCFQGGKFIHDSGARAAGSRRHVMNASLRANRSRECAPDDRLREAIYSHAKGLEKFVKPGLVPGIHVLTERKTWMAESSPAMTTNLAL